MPRFVQFQRERTPCLIAVDKVLWVRDASHPNSPEVPLCGIYLQDQEQPVIVQGTLGKVWSKLEGDGV